jgi:hypothetical protein
MTGIFTQELLGNCWASNFDSTSIPRWLAMVLLYCPVSNPPKSSRWWR